jgi:hypothetical protein
MAVILSFDRDRSAVRRLDVEVAADEVIAAFGADAGLRYVAIAEASDVGADTKRLLREIAAEIERRQSRG